MRFSTQRETLLKPLQKVIGAVERRQTKPILGNVLLKAEPGGLTVTATDLELELVAQMALEAEEGGATTVPARKLFDICRALPEAAMLEFYTQGERATVRSSRSRFSLAGLPAEGFPAVEGLPVKHSLDLEQGELKTLLEHTAFAMAQQDVRYYLNGLLLELTQEGIKAVATDGHRLALYEIPKTLAAVMEQQVIVPRKGVLELQRLLEHEPAAVALRLSPNHIQVSLPGLRFTSKLIDGRFPDYNRVIPQGGDKLMEVNTDLFRQALTRTAILSNEKYRGIRVSLEGERMQLQAHNPEQEEAEEVIEVSYEGPPVEIGFNVNYLLDVLSVVDGDRVELRLKDSNSSVLITAPNVPQARYVVMPMRL
jgi:DNA polymerase-3 subunit beta